jgi:hypothetical protein
MVQLHRGINLARSSNLLADTHEKHALLFQERPYSLTSPKLMLLIPFFSLYSFPHSLEANVIRLVDPFNFVAGVVGPIIAKGVASSGRGIRSPSNSLIRSFNMTFFTSRPLIELSRAYPVAQCIWEIWEGGMFCRLISERYFPFLFFTCLFSITNFLDSL